MQLRSSQVSFVNQAVSSDVFSSMASIALPYHSNGTYDFLSILNKTEKTSKNITYFVFCTVCTVHVPKDKTAVYLLP